MKQKQIDTYYPLFTFIAYLVREELEMVRENILPNDRLVHDLYTPYYCYGYAQSLSLSN